MGVTHLLGGGERISAQLPHGEGQVTYLPGKREVGIHHPPGGRWGWVGHLPTWSMGRRIKSGGSPSLLPDRQTPVKTLPSFVLRKWPVIRAEIPTVYSAIFSNAMKTQNTEYKIPAVHYKPLAQYLLCHTFII